MSIDHELVGAWEIDAKAGAFLRRIFAKRSDQSNIYIGSVQGDMTQVKAHDLPDADGVITGPPCPPWSASGNRANWSDSRALPSKHLFKWLLHLCRRKRPLRFFIIENVRGVLGKAGRGYLDRLRAVLPRGWVLAVLRMNSHCVGQTRPRAYLVGWKSKKKLSPKQATNVIATKLPPLPDRNLSDMLLDLPNENPKKVLTAQQTRNFRKWMRKLQPSLNDKRKKGMVSCFEVDRNPAKSRAGSRADDKIFTLRASGHPIWLVSLGEKHHGPSISRLLSVEERCLLQGFSPGTIPPEASARTIRQVMGNAMTVPVVGSVIGATLLQLQAEKGDSSSDGDASSENDVDSEEKGDSSSDGDSSSENDDDSNDSAGESDGSSSEADSGVESSS